MKSFNAISFPRAILAHSSPPRACQNSKLKLKARRWDITLNFIILSTVDIRSRGDIRGYRSGSRGRCCRASFGIAVRRCEMAWIGNADIVAFEDINVAATSVQGRVPCTELSD
jgi:hypothetical protein